MQEYMYLVGSLLLLFIWILLYASYPAGRKRMLLVSTIWIPFGLIGQQFFFTTDWWNPKLIIDVLPVGVEDVIYTFSLSGVSAIVYPAVSRMKLNDDVDITTNKVAVLVGIALAAMIGSFLLKYTIGLHSLFANVAVFFVVGIIIMILRPDLIRFALYSAILLPLVKLPIHAILSIISPNWVQDVWNIENLTGIVILGAPIEDLVWYVGVGFVFGTMIQRVISSPLNEKLGKKIPS